MLTRSTVRAAKNQKPDPNDSIMDEKTGNLWQILSTNLEWIRSSDTKATAILTIYGIVITLVYSNASDILKTINLNPTMIFFSVLSAFTSLLAIFFGFRVIQPRVFPPSYVSVIFFGSVVSNFKDMESYHQFVNKLLDRKEGLDIDLARQIYINSVIASKKYRDVAYSIRFFVASLVLLLSELTFTLLR